MAGRKTPKFWEKLTDITLSATNAIWPTGRVHKSRAPGAVMSNISGPPVWDLASCHPTNAQNFEMASRFLGKLLCPWTALSLNPASSLGPPPLLGKQRK